MNRVKTFRKKPVQQAEEEAHRDGQYQYDDSQTGRFFLGRPN